MKRTKQLLGTVSAAALIVMSSAPAFAAGTSAGDEITNNVTVTYEVGGVEQNEEIASDTFTVDRKIDVTVEFTGTSSTVVNPGEQNVVLAFEVTNLSNATIDLGLSALLNGGTGADANIDDENFQYYLDVDGNGQLDGSDILITTAILDEVLENQTIAVLVVTDIGLDAANGNTFDVVLTADALEDNGAQVVATAGANTAGLDTVLADGAGTTDVVEAGDFSDLGTYVVAGAELTVVKTSRIVSDPINGTNNPKAIPGAVIEYCIAVANGAGAATATAVTVADDLPADVEFVENDFGIFINGDATINTSGLIPVATCTIDPTDTNGEVTGDAVYTIGGGTNGLNEIEAVLADIPASTVRSVYFRVTIN